MNEPACIDLRAVFPNLRIRWSEDHVPGSPRDPWDEEIVCRHGVIWPHGGSRLQAYCTGRYARSRLEALPCVTIWQKGDRELTVVFEIVNFAAVADVMEPKLKRRPGGRPFSAQNPPTGDRQPPGSPNGGESRGRVGGTP